MCEQNEIMAHGVILDTFQPGAASTAPARGLGQNVLGICPGWMPTA